MYCTLQLTTFQPLLLVPLVPALQSSIRSTFLLGLFWDVYLQTSLRRSVLSPLHSPPPGCGGLWQRLPDSCMSITLIRRPDSLQSPLSQATPKRELACCLTGEGYFLFIWMGCSGLAQQTCFLQVLECPIWKFTSLRDHKGASLPSLCRAEAAV